MNPTEPSPPRAHVHAVPSLSAPFSGVLDLSPAAATAPESFFSVLDRRESKCSSTLLSVEQVSDVLWHGCRERSQIGSHRSHRASPSAGGLHPIYIVIQRISAVDGDFLYDAAGHRLLRLHVLEPERLKLIKRAELCLPRTPATLFWLVGVPGRTAAKYPSPGFFVERDAGYLAATITLVATATRLCTVPLGATGFPHLNHLTDWSEEIKPLGAVNIGQ
jgi:SagB-type dehydrogenase family enzyme